MAVSTPTALASTKPSESWCPVLCYPQEVGSLADTVIEFAYGFTIRVVNVTAK
jgi:hypothetical protein